MDVHDCAPECEREPMARYAPSSMMASCESAATAAGDDDDDAVLESVRAIDDDDDAVLESERAIDRMLDQAGALMDAAAGRLARCTDQDPRQQLDAFVGMFRHRYPMRLQHAAHSDLILSLVASL